MPYLHDSMLLAHPVRDVFAVALDLERYPGILGYVKSVEILSTSANHVEAKLTLDVAFFEFSYMCKIAFRDNEEIVVTSSEAIFERFVARCQFAPVRGSATKISYTMDVKLNSALLEFLAGLALPYQSYATVRSFERYLDSARGGTSSVRLGDAKVTQVKRAE